jgi:endogenous inhibitor of DNA gyrase (YacG/DUF329 family)
MPNQTTVDQTAGAAALRAAADFYERVLNESLDPDSDPRYCTAVRDVVMGLRRRADETAGKSCAHCGQPVNRVNGTLAAWWVHDPGGNTVCDPQHAASSTRATPERVKHSGPDAEFCVLCLSGEHERVDEQPAETEAVDSGPLLFWNEAAGVTYQDGRITLHVDQAVNLAQAVPAGSLILQLPAAETLRKALTRALTEAHAPRCPHCGESLADYDTDAYVYRAGDERPYCSSKCVVDAYQAAGARQDGA